MLRSILVALDASPWTEAATDLAIEWSKRFGAKILGLGILDEPGIRAAEPAPIGVSRFKIKRDAARLVEANEQVKRLVARFESVCEVAGVYAPADVADLMPWMGEGFMGGVQITAVESLKEAGEKAKEAGKKAKEAFRDSR